jgi:hypothetical protein
VLVGVCELLATVVRLKTVLVAAPGADQDRTPRHTIDGIKVSDRSLYHETYIKYSKNSAASVAREGPCRLAITKAGGIRDGRRRSVIRVSV